MKVAKTKDTLNNIYLDALRIRNQVFVEEQGVPLTREIDKDEANAIHFVLYSDTDEAMATVRLLPLDDNQLKLQRMAVKIDFRNHGFGKVIIAAAENFAKGQGFKKIKLGSQKSAIGFYESIGYQSYGEPFIDAGIEHVSMEKNL
ncbi:GNAT family acetyltransferase [Enterococcus sp. JM4C]|uniref:GNAT family N-acetyltransferase n=1 Tax=Candidatus Enterococcus huntleyi TaxID=1857217 RepID=UPI00137B7903|nr:GNAT family N-acetyltransferase [Enterococcus sp. JM4C]KAF1297269.1 GNAT family acetyltransferase [Enterococcus sp. JM4C]